MALGKLAPYVLPLALIATPAVATEIVIPPELAQPDRMAKSMWDAFKEGCGFAFSDPEGFLRSVPNPDHEGRQAIAGSQDGQALEIYKRSPGMPTHLEVHFVGTVEGLHIHCAAHFFDDVSVGAIMRNPLWSNPSSQNYLALAEANERALRNYISSDTEKPVAGGILQIDPPNVALGGNHPQVSGYMSVVAEFGELRLPAMVEFAAIGGAVFTSWLRPYD